MAVKNKPQLLLLFILLAFLNEHCTSTANKEELDKMQWLEGRWEKEKDGIKTVETWHRKTKNVYDVSGNMLEGTDTIFTENIVVKPGSGRINYIVTIEDQNNGEPVIFKLAQNSGRKLVFKNPDHDFPQRISYTSLTPDSVLVQLEGAIKGKTVTEEYTMIRR